jgi:hypothetical protein
VFFLGIFDAAKWESSDFYGIYGSTFLEDLTRSHIFSGKNGDHPYEEDLVG